MARDEDARGPVLLAALALVGVASAARTATVTVRDSGTLKMTERYIAIFTPRR